MARGPHSNDFGTKSRIQVRSGNPASSPATRDSNTPTRTRSVLVLSASPAASCCWRWLGWCVARGSSTAAVLSARSTARQLLERACTMRSPCGHDAFAVLARRVLHVSAAARRGAAAYADGCEQIFGHSHLISQSPGMGQSDLRAGFYTTFCVRHDGTIAPACPTC